MEEVKRHCTYCNSVCIQDIHETLGGIRQALLNQATALDKLEGHINRIDRDISNMEDNMTELEQDIDYLKYKRRSMSPTPSPFLSPAPESTT